ncbi:MAG: nitroreductase family protein [Verrucomicrobia bacterium]|nr:MAG: nitroreductase family protein [Verrucomicrobiota bacterium]
MDSQNAIFTRASVRSYDPSKRADAGQIREVLAAAMSAPSAMGRRPWEFVVATRPELLERIMQIHPYCSSLGDAGCAIIVCGNLDAQYKTPAGGYYVYDCSAATQNLLIRAKELGLDTCWCAIAPEKGRIDAFRRLFGIPENVEPMALVILGYAAEPVRRERTFEEEKVHMQKW